MNEISDRYHYLCSLSTLTQKEKEELLDFRTALYKEILRRGGAAPFSLTPASDSSQPVE